MPRQGKTPSKPCGQAASRRRKAICTTPRKLCGVFVFMPAPALRVVKMRRHSFAPRSSTGTIALSFIFTPRGRLAPLFFLQGNLYNTPQTMRGVCFYFSDRGIFYPLLPFGLSSPVTEQLKLALRGKVNFAACLTLGCSFYPTKKSKISLRGPLLHLPKCGTYVTFLLRVYFSHPHNRADDDTN